MTELISNPEEKKAIKSALSEISDSMTRISAEQDLIKDIKLTLFEDHKDKLSKKQINKMAKTFHKQSFKQENAEFDEFLYLYESITGEKLEE